MPIRTPSPLFPGARVALAAPSSGVSVEQLRGAVDGMRALGLEAVVFPSSLPDYRHGYLAADDAQRAADLNRAFADPSVEGVWCIRGGYGAARLLPLLDWRCIAAHPKWLGGFSDITALHTALQQNSRLVSYHVSMPAYWAERPLDGWSLDYVRRALFGGLTGPLPGLPGRPWRTLAPGLACGPLCGGNLSLIADSLGTPWELDTRGKLLFLEDVGERSHRVDAMLTQLRNAGKLRDCAGILLGYWTDIGPEDPERSLTLDEIFTELLLPAGKPILAGLPCGHDQPTMALPLGAPAKMDACAGTLTVLPG